MADDAVRVLDGYGLSSAHVIGDHVAQFPEVNWTDRAEAIRFLVEDSRLTSGSAHPFDDERATRLVKRDYDRARNFSSVTNHMRLGGGETWKDRLHEIRAPLLVMHGTEDPIFSIEHGIALSKAVAGASLVRIQGGGHELHEAIGMKSSRRSSSIPVRPGNVSGMTKVVETEY
jgi:pimeloyl-ACP methyl ester carboxylesterase